MGRSPLNETLVCVFLQYFPGTKREFYFLLEGVSGLRNDFDMLYNIGYGFISFVFLVVMYE